MSIEEVLPSDSANQWAKTIRKALYHLVKRLLDLTLAAGGLILLSPLLLLVAIIIKVGSRGPVFYLGVRTGKHGRPFRIIKFRTMVPNADKIGSTATALNDPRITTIGHFLRRYKLDELPQLFNVLRGEMSLVGPRPEVEEHTSVYSAEEQIILSVTPGITDYSSLRFINLGELLGAEDANRVFVEKYRAEKNLLRMHYVKTQSMVTDFKILFLTLFRLIVRA